MPGQTGHRALLFVDREVVEGEPAGRGRAQRDGLDDGVVPGGGVVRAGLAARMAVQEQPP